MTPNPDLEHATSKLPSCGDPGLPRPLPAQRERKVSPHRRKKRGRRSFERTAARRSRIMILLLNRYAEMNRYAETPHTCAEKRIGSTCKSQIFCC